MTGAWTHLLPISEANPSPPLRSSSHRITAAVRSFGFKLSKMISRRLAAFVWLEQNMEMGLKASDEHFDWVYMLDEGDWKKLNNEWMDKGDEWRESFA